MKYPDFVKFKFYIYYNSYEKSYMYTELTSGEYAKTYHKNNKTISEYISFEEYASALAHLMLRNKNP